MTHLFARTRGFGKHINIWQNIVVHEDTEEENRVQKSILNTDFQCFMDTDYRDIVNAKVKTDGLRKGKTARRTIEDLGSHRYAHESSLDSIE